MSAHAHLVVGPRGVAEDEARRLAAGIVAADDDDRALDLVRRGQHPDVVEVEPVARTYSVRDDVRARILPEAHRSPVEGDQKVIVLLDAHRLDDAAHALLKTLEEPPERTYFVLVTDAPDELAETVRSRCRRVDVALPTDDDIRRALAADGVEGQRAELAISLAGGRPGRARDLAGRLAGVRLAFVEAVSELDGTGAAVAQQSARIQEAVRAAIVGLEEEHARAAEELTGALEAGGYAERTAVAQRRRLEERQKRALRRARTEAWLEGITAIETVYRDVLAPDRPRNLDRSPPPVHPADAAAALDACREARDAFELNPNESLLLEHLLLHLPPGR